MTYEAHYINPLIQFGVKSFDLVIEDTEEVLPSFRQNVSFKESVSDKEMLDFANNFIDNRLLELEKEKQEALSSVLVDLPKKEVD